MAGAKDMAPMLRSQKLRMLLTHRKLLQSKAIAIENDLRGTLRIDWSGRISRCGDEMMRVMLYEAAQSMLRSQKWSWLKAWAMQIARRRGMKKAIVALTRRLAVIMHRQLFQGGPQFLRAHENMQRPKPRNP